MAGIYLNKVTYDICACRGDLAPRADRWVRVTSNPNLALLDVRQLVEAAGLVHDPKLVDWVGLRSPKRRAPRARPLRRAS